MPGGCGQNHEAIGGVVLTSYWYNKVPAVKVVVGPSETVEPE